MVTIYKISTHAPAGGATSILLLFHHLVQNFYSRPCGRGDFGGHGNDSVCKLISTHAPAGGATQCSCSSNHSSN